jgi:hypothetical protein
VHTDVCGPTQVSSLGGSRYYVTFIDDETRKKWVYCIRKKYDVFDTFKKWKDFNIGGYRWPPTFSNWLKTVFWQFWQFTNFSRF